MKRIQKARIQWLTLCPRGKNQLPVLYKADGTVEFATVTKASEDLGEITAIVYPVDRADSDEHVASAPVIRDMAHNFQKEGGQIDIRHDGKVVDKDRAYVAESFIVQKGDPRFTDMKDYDGNPVDATDAWATVIKIDDPKLRQLYKDGEWNGISMQGQGLLTIEKSDDDGPAPRWFSKFLKACGLEGSPSNNDTDQVDQMKIEEMEALMKAQTESLVKAFAPTKEEIKKGDDQIDLTDRDAVQKLADKLAKEDAQKDIDLTDPKAVQALATKLAKEEVQKNIDLSDPKAVRELADRLAKEETDALQKDGEGDSDEVRTLKAELQKAEGRSTKSKGNDADDTSGMEDFSKEEVQAMELGSRMAAFNNKARGLKVDA